MTQIKTIPNIIKCILDKHYLLDMNESDFMVFSDTMIALDVEEVEQEEQYSHDKQGMLVNPRVEVNKICVRG